MGSRLKREERKDILADGYSMKGFTYINIPKGTYTESDSVVESAIQKVVSNLSSISVDNDKS